MAGEELGALREGFQDDLFSLTDFVHTTSTSVSRSKPQYNVHMLWKKKIKKGILSFDFSSQAHATSSELHLRTSEEDLEGAVAAEDALMLMMLRVYLY